MCGIVDVQHLGEYPDPLGGRQVVTVDLKILSGIQSERVREVL